MTKNTIDINCDLGEGMGNDVQLMPLISSCNIACGGHAGDKNSMRETIALALKYEVKIGAHPSYPDRSDFGRVALNMSKKDLKKSITEQLNTFKEVLDQSGDKLHHIKPHGALYNVIAKDHETAMLFVEIMLERAKNTYLYVPYQSVIHQLAVNNKLKVKLEAFADRNYNSDLSLVSRKNTNATIHNPKDILKHLLKMIQYKKVTSIDGVEVPIEASTFCIHGDNPNAIEILKFLHEALPKNGVTIA